MSVEGFRISQQCACGFDFEPVDVLNQLEGVDVFVNSNALLPEQPLRKLWIPIGRGYGQQTIRTIILGEFDMEEVMR